MEETLNRAIALTQLETLAPNQYATWSMFFDEVNEVEDEIREIEDAIADARKRIDFLDARRWRTRRMQANAWDLLVKAANAAFDANKSKI